MPDSNFDCVSRRRALELCSVTGGIAISTTGAAAADEEQSKENELLLVESGFRYEPVGGELDIDLRRPVDFAPKYWTGPDGIIATPQADRDERRRLHGSNAVVSNGRIHRIGREYGGPSNRAYLPVGLRYGRRAIDAAPVEGDVEHPRYSIHRRGSTVVVEAVDGTERIDAGESAEFRFAERTYTVTKHVAVEADGRTDQAMEGEGTCYRHDTRTSEQQFVPTLSVRNGGRVTVCIQGGQR